MADVAIAPFGWERTALAVERVKERLRRACIALGQAGIAYAVVGGNAVAEWVGRVDDAAVRYTQDVDILVRRADLESVKAAMAAAGFVYDNVPGVDLFLDGPNGRPKDGVHLLFAGEKVRPEHGTATPDLAESEAAAHFRVVSLPALVQMKLESNRDKDRTHVRDLIGVGLVGASWLTRLSPPLAARLQHLLDTPDG